jgi:hypothetical protein
VPAALEHEPHLTRDVLASYLGRALSAALVDRAGCTWASLWSGPSLLRVPSGELLELRGLVAAAASAPCWAGALRRRVADAGLAI